MTRRVVAFFALTLALSWGLYSLLEVPGGLGVVPAGSPATLGIALLKQFSPTLAGLGVAAALGGREGLRTLRSSALSWRAGGRWYLVVLVGFPAALVGASALAGLIIGAPLRSDEPAGPLLFGLVITVLVAGISEELFGWRGFALPALLTGTGALSASVILGVVWAQWHIPPWGILAQGVPLGEQVTGHLSLIGLSVLMTWVYRRSGSALLAGVVMHNVYNAAGFYVSGPAWVGDWATVALALGVAVAELRSARARRPERSRAA